MHLVSGRAGHSCATSRLRWWTLSAAASILALFFSAISFAPGERVNPAAAAAGSGLFAFGSTTGASFTSGHSSGGNYLVSWASLEPQPGTYYWSSLDAALGRAAAAGKTLVLRVYTNWSVYKQGSPNWFFNLSGADEYYPSNTARSRGYESPVPWDSVFQDRFGAFVRALGQRYNGHPALEFIQTTGVGVYGEIYLGSTQPAGYTYSLHLSAAKFWIDTWRGAFPDTDLALMVNGIGHNIGENAAIHAVSRGYYLQSNNHKNTVATRAILNTHDQNTKIVVEAEDGGCPTGTVAEGFEQQMQETFSFGYEIDYLMLCYESFTDAQTKLKLPWVKSQLRSGTQAVSSAPATATPQPTSTTAAQTAPTRTPTPSPTPTRTAIVSAPTVATATPTPPPTATPRWSWWGWFR